MNANNNKTFGGSLPANPAKSHNKCVWIIVIPKGKIVELVFKDRFHVTGSSDCKGNYVEVQDGRYR